MKEDRGSDFLLTVFFFLEAKGKIRWIAYKAEYHHREHCYFLCEATLNTSKTKQALSLDGLGQKIGSLHPGANSGYRVRKT